MVVQYLLTIVLQLHSKRRHQLNLGIMMVEDEVGPFTLEIPPLYLMNNVLSNLIVILLVLVEFFLVKNPL